MESRCATPKVTKYQRCNFIIQIHQFTIKIDQININLLYECVKIVEFNFNSHVFHVMYQETRFLNQDACFLNKEGRRQFLSVLFPMVGHLFQNYDTIYVRFFLTYTCNHSCYTIYVRFFVTYTCVLFPSI